MYICIYMHVYMYTYMSSFYGSTPSKIQTNCWVFLAEELLENMALLRHRCSITGRPLIAATSQGCVPIYKVSGPN